MSGNSNQTSDDDTSHYEGALLEDILDRVKAIAEGQVGLWDKLDEVKTELKADIAIVKDAVGAQSGDLDDHERRLKEQQSRITQLEQSAA